MKSCKLPSRWVGYFEQASALHGGLASIRQDINISVQNGAVVEVKGVQASFDQLVKVIEYEMHRQYGLIVISQKLKEKNVDIKKVGDRIEDVSDILGNKVIFKNC